MKPSDYPITACTPSYKGPDPTVDDRWNMHQYLFSRHIKQLQRRYKWQAVDQANSPKN